MYRIKAMLLPNPTQSQRYDRLDIATLALNALRCFFFKFDPMGTKLNEKKWEVKQ
jgi:hypothetical protein